MTAQKKVQLILYRLSFVTLSAVTVGCVIFSIVFSESAASLYLFRIAFATEPTHAIILTIVVRRIVDSSKTALVDVGEVTQLSKKKAPTQDRDNIYTVAAAETVVVSSNQGTNVTASAVMDSRHGNESNLGNSIIQK